MNKYLRKKIFIAALFSIVSIVMIVSRFYQKRSNLVSLQNSSSTSLLLITPTSREAASTTIPNSATTSTENNNHDGEEIMWITNDAEGMDLDNDGLLGIDETKIYSTNPQNSDTDSDGHKDGEEVKKGYNPCGDGPLPSITDLKKACANFKK